MSRLCYRWTLLPILLCLGLLGARASAVPPLDPDPVWTSNAMSHVATGGGWADANGDGWLDLVVANGNDILRQHLVVYLNDGTGNLPLAPSWSSSDIDYHGHLDLGDVNGDGIDDVAVAVYLGAAGFSEPGGVKLYQGDGVGAFSANPIWAPDVPFYCFSVAFGDADGDGDLDLACAAGESYHGPAESYRIFFNVDGSLETTPGWTSASPGYALDVTWDDVDFDGDLDVVFCGSGTPMQVYYNHQTAGGSIETTPSWSSTDLPEWGNTAAFGDLDGDGFPELTVADNSQQGGPGRFKVYGNSSGTLATAPSWTSSTGGYGSHVSCVDLELDGYPVLATGRWWGPVQLYGNTAGTLTASPVWSSNTSSVIENLAWGDVDNDALHSDGVTMATGDGQRTAVRLGTAPVRSVETVLIDGVPLSASEWCAHRAGGWVSLATPPPSNAGIEVRYAYSTDLDMAVTNWDSSVGNYLFENTRTAASIPELTATTAPLQAAPNPLRTRTRIRTQIEPAVGETIASVVVYDVQGRELRSLHEGPLTAGLWSWEWDGRTASGSRAADGVYFVRLTMKGAPQRTVRLVVAGR